MDSSSKERRQHARIYRNFIIIYHVKGELTPQHHRTQINDISKGGLNFSTTHPLKQGDQITVNLKTPFIADSIILDGVVIDCKEKIPGMIFQVRLKFQGVSEYSMKVLEKIDHYAKSSEAESS